MELEVLTYVTDHAPIRVRGVVDYFAAKKGYVRTTLLNVLERLREKGFLSRSKINGIFHYSPKESKSELFRNLVTQFIQTTLKGSHSPFMAYLADEASLTEAEWKELRRIANEKVKIKKL